MVAASHGERPPLHVVPSTSPVSVNWCSTQHAGTGVGTGEGWDVGTDVGVFVGTVVGSLVGLNFEGAAEGWAVGVFVGVADVGNFVGTGVGAAVGTVVAVVGSGVGTGVGKIVGTGVGKIVGTVVSSSRRAPSRRPLDRRAFGPLRGGCCCPHANALRSTHRPRRSMLRALLSPLVCPEALLGTPSRLWLISLSRLGCLGAESPIGPAGSP